MRVAIMTCLISSLSVVTGCGQDSKKKDPTTQAGGRTHHQALYSE